MHLKVKLLSLLYILLLCLASFSIQVRADARELILATALSDSNTEAFWALLQRTDRNLSDMHEPERVSKVEIDNLFSLSCDGIGTHFEDGQALREDAQASANDIGLDLEGGVRSGLDQTNSGALTNARKSAYIGLGWDVLNGGVRENKGKGRWFDLRADRADLRAKMEYENRLNQCRADKIPDAFLPEKAKLLRLKTELLRLLLSTSRDAYLNGEIYLEDMLEVEQELQVASSDLSNIQPRLFNFLRRDLEFPNMMPLLDVDITAIIEAIDVDKRIDQLEDLDAEIISQKKENERETRLRFYLRYEATGSGFKQHGPAAGAYFKVPLFEDKKASTASYIAKSKTVHEDERMLRKRNARHAYKKFLETRELVLRQWYRYLRSTERLRRSLVHEKFDALSVDRVAAAERAVTAINAAIELERANNLLYRRASEILSYAKLLYSPRYISIAPMIGEGYRGRSGSRGIYIWSKAFNSHSNDFLLSFFQAKQISTALISAGKSVNKERFKSFLDQARRKHVRVEPVFSNNDWLEKKNYSDAVKKIAAWVHLFSHKEQAAQIKLVHMGLGTVHFDIEPQALARYKGKFKKQAPVALEHLVEHVHQHFPKLRISISLPVYWDADAYRRIARYTGSLYMMSYGTDKAATIIRRLSEVRKAVADARIVVALRVADYRSELELENVIKEIRTQTGIRHFAIHSMHRYLNLTDKKNIPLKLVNQSLTMSKK